MTSLKKFQAILNQPHRQAHPITLYFDETEEAAKAKARALLATLPHGSYLELYDVTEQKKCVVTYGKNDNGSLSKI